MKNRVLSLLACGTLVATAACSSKTPDTAASDSAADVAASDSMDDSAMASSTADADASTAFLADAVKGDNSEVKLGQLAASKGSSAEVRDFGSMLVADHGKHKQDVIKLGAAASDAVTPEADSAYTRLNGLSGAAFDKEFAAVMVTEHNKAIAMYQQQADSGDGSPVTAMAKETLPKLKKHLETARSLAR